MIEQPPNRDKQRMYKRLWKRSKRVSAATGVQNKDARQKQKENANNTLQ